MAAITRQLNIVNRVLRRLREEQVSAVTDSPYAELLAEMLNEVIIEVGNAHEWTQRETVFTVSLDASSPAPAYAAITGMEAQDMIKFDPNTGLPSVYIYDPADLTQGQQMYLLTDEHYLSKLREDSSTTSAWPNMFRITSSVDTNYRSIQVYPNPSEDRTIYITADKGPTILDIGDTTQIDYDPNVLYNGVLYYALNERGEELGEPGNIAERRYYNSLADAIHNDSIQNQRANGYESYRD